MMENDAADLSMPLIPRGFDRAFGAQIRKPKPVHKPACAPARNNLFMTTTLNNAGD